MYRTLNERNDGIFATKHTTIPAAPPPPPGLLSPSWEYPSWELWFLWTSVGVEVEGITGRRVKGLGKKEIQDFHEKTATSSSPWSLAQSLPHSQSPLGDIRFFEFFLMIEPRIQNKIATTPCSPWGLLRLALPQRQLGNVVYF